MEKSYGPYTIVRELFKGGMGAVYLAEHAELKRTVALKVLRPEYGDNQDFVRRFEQEARTIARLEHSNILQVYDFGRSEGTCYLAMELVDGRDLSILLKDNGLIPWEIAAVILHTVCLALQVAHDASVVHRDIKLSNILVKSNGTVKLADFGIAKDLETPGLTRGDEMVGTPYSLSPEQIRGEPVTTLTDIYCVGICLFHAVTGRLPYEAPSLASLMERILHEDAPSFAELGVAAPESFENLVRRCLNKDSSARYSGASELAKALSECLYQYRVLNDRSEIEAYLADAGNYVKSRRGTRIQEKVREAEAREAQGDIFGALQSLREALALDPDNTAIEDRISLLSCRAPSQEGTAVIPLPARPGRRARLLIPVFAALVLLAGFLLFRGGRTAPPERPLPPAAVRPAPQESAAVAPMPSPPPAPAPKAAAVSRKLEPAAADTAPVPTPAVVQAAPAADTCSGRLTLFSGMWADVFVDGVKKGQSPTKEPLLLPCGEHELKLENNLGKLYFSRVTISPEKIMHLTIEKNAFQ